MLLELADHDGDVDCAIGLAVGRDRRLRGDHRPAAEGKAAGRGVRLAGARRRRRPGVVARQRSGLLAVARGGRRGVRRPRSRGGCPRGAAKGVRQSPRGPEVPGADGSRRAGRDTRGRAWPRDRGPRGARSGPVRERCSDGPRSPSPSAISMRPGPPRRSTAPATPGRELAGALEKTHPGRAAELYQPHVDKQLVHPDSKLYPEIAKTLSKMRDLCERSGGRSSSPATSTAYAPATPAAPPSWPPSPAPACERGALISSPALAGRRLLR